MNKPNIILICSDQHRSDWIGCAGSCNVQTPHLNSLYHEGVMFSNTYCAAPLCGPSRMSMLTSRYPSDLGIYWNEHCLRSDIPTFVHSLALSGYETVLCGRMHFSGADQRHGFQKRLTGDISTNYAGGPQSFPDELKKAAGGGFESCKNSGVGSNPILEYDTDVTRDCISFLKKRRVSASNNMPLFLTVGLAGPHSPYRAPKEYYNQAYARMKASDSLVPIEHVPINKWDKKYLEFENLIGITEEQIIRSRVSYAAMIDYMDEQIGQIITEAKKLQSPTILIYISDHGDMMGEKRMFAKKCLYEPSVKVPMLITQISPNNQNSKMRKGEKIDVPISLLDLGPTIIALAESYKLPNAVGQSFCEMLYKNSSNEKLHQFHVRPVVSELHIGWTRPIRMLRMNNYKLIYHHGYDKVQLFNVHKDPNEIHDLANIPEFDSVKEKLKERLLCKWNPEEIDKDFITRKSDLDFLWEWGERIGMGPMELWKHWDVH